MFWVFLSKDKHRYYFSEKEVDVISFKYRVQNIFLIKIDLELFKVCRFFRFSPRLP